MTFRYQNAITKTATSRMLLVLTMLLMVSTSVSATVPPCDSSNDSISKLVAALDSPKFQIRQDASDQLYALKLKSVPSLVSLALTGNPEQMWRAISILHEIGVGGDRRTMVKIGRVLYMLGTQRPELLQKAHGLEELWKGQQTSRLISEIRQLGGTVTKNLTAAGGPQAVIVNRFIMRNGQIVIDGEEEEKPSAQTGNKKTGRSRTLSNKEITKRTREIIKANSADDLRAFNAASKIAGRSNPALISNNSDKQAYDIILDKTWRGSDADFAVLRDFPRIYSVQMSDIRVTRKMMDVLSQCRTQYVTLAQCDVDSRDLFAFSEKNPDAVVSVRGKSLVGVQGNIGRTFGSECSISSVVEGGPADRAGILAGDVVVKVDRQEIRSFQDLVFYIAGKNPTDQVSVTVRRGNKSKTLKVKLADYHSINP